MDIQRCRNTKRRYVRHAECATHSRDRGGQNTCLDIPLAGVCRSALSRKQWRLTLSKLEKLFEAGKHVNRTGLGCELTDQLTP